MTVLDNDDFLKKYGIEFPSPSSLAVLHAEPASRVPNGGYTFSEDALQIIGNLVVPSGYSGVQFNHWIASGDDTPHHLILFFLDTSYHMAHHIWGIRETKDEIAMTSYLGPNAQKNVAEDPPPVGLLYVADVPTLTELAERSPFLGQLLPVADGPTDDAIWAYFLGKAEQQEIEDGEVAKAPREKSIVQLVGTGLTGDQT
mgnify:CR=1 FL=1|jgi:hypothetical protein